MIYYSNYDLSTDGFDELKAELIDEYGKDDVPSDNTIWQMLYDMDREEFEDIISQLTDMFKDKYLLFYGSIGRWSGTVAGGKIDKGFNKLFYEGMIDCDYFEIGTDEEGLYIQGSHHDGTNLFHIREVTEEGYQYYDDWNYYRIGNDKNEEQIHTDIVNNKQYSKMITDDDLQQYI